MCGCSGGRRGLEEEVREKKEDVLVAAAAAAAEAVRQLVQQGIAEVEAGGEEEWT